MSVKDSPFIMLCQRSLNYNLKAIHNNVCGAVVYLAAVSKIVKLQFESNSQQISKLESVDPGCVKDR